MNEFKTYHPIVNFIYFVIIIGFSCFFMHPLCLVISIICSFTYSVVLRGRDSLRKNLIYMLPMILLMALINPLFNHRGITIIGYLPSQNPITLESVIYGVGAAMMIASIIFWFACYNEIMTSDKFIYLFGKIIPSMSLVISMTLRFIPRFTAQLKAVINAQRCLGRDLSEGSLITRGKNGISIISVMITRAFESSVETADSMKARGYGLKGRSAYSIYTFDKRDANAILCMLIPALIIIVGGFFGGMSFDYFPKMTRMEFSLLDTVMLISYFILHSFPLIMEWVEVKRWNALKSKI